MIFDRVFLKFAVAGIINTIIGAAIMFVMYNIFGFGYWVSSAVNYIGGGIVSFFINKHWTFSVRKWSLYIVIAFIAVNVISYLFAYKIAITVIYLTLSSYSVKAQDNIAMAAGMCIFSGLNYLGQRFIVFSKNTPFSKKEKLSE